MEETQAPLLISVAHRPVLPVWKHVARMLNRRFGDWDKLLIVPNRDLRSFQRFTPASFALQTDEDIARLWLKNFDEQSSAGIVERRGWYLQQFLKIQALFNHQNRRQLLLWDADTIPLRHLTFFTEENNPRYFFGSEHHEKYFETIDKLLGLEKRVVPSFVSQCLPIRGDDMKRFEEFLEQKHGVSAMRAIIDNTDFGHPASFSEYETLGTFATQNCSPEFDSQDVAWSRNGWRKIGSAFLASLFYSRQEHPELAFVAFERKNLLFRARSFLKGLLREISSSLRNSLQHLR